MSVDPSHPNAKFLNDMAEAEKNVMAFLADGDFSHLTKVADATIADVLNTAAEAFASRGSSLGPVDRLKAMAEVGPEAEEHVLVEAHEARLKREGRA